MQSNMIIDIAVCSDNERSIQFKLQLLSKEIAKRIRHTLNIRAINSQNSQGIRVYCVLHHVQHMYISRHVCDPCKRLHSRKYNMRTSAY